MVSKDVILKLFIETFLINISYTFYTSYILIEDLRLLYFKNKLHIYMYINNFFDDFYYLNLEEKTGLGFFNCFGKYLNGVYKNFFLKKKNKS